MTIVLVLAVAPANGRCGTGRTEIRGENQYAQ
jgi:hypothetical protein